MDDIKFRLVRDEILNKEVYQKIMFKMFEQKKFNPKKYYEALFLSKIHPLRKCNNLKRKSIKNLIYNIRKILKISINQGGSSIIDFKNAYGKSGNFQQFFNIYGQENKNCSRISCKGKIKKISISNRSSFYCNNCQN